jgi:cell division protein FtsL
MKTGHPTTRRFGDWLITIGVIAATLLLAGTLVFTVILQFDNRQLISETDHLAQANHALTIENHALALRSDRNHAEEQRLYAAMRYICLTFIPKCTLPKT